MLWLCIGEYAGPANVRAFAMYARARFKREQVHELFMTYVADSLRLKGEGKYLSSKFRDMLHPVRETADPMEVIKQVVERGELVMR